MFNMHKRTRGEDDVRPGAAKKPKTQIPTGLSVPENSQLNHDVASQVSKDAL